MLPIGLRLVGLLVVAACSSTPAPEAPAADLHALEAYEGGSKEVEERYIAFLGGFFGRPAASGEPLLRGTHAVGSCTAAEFAIDRDFWEYDILTDSWREIAPFGGSPRYGAVAFVIDGKGYVGTGHDGNDLKDFWMYDPEVDEWEQVVSLPGNKRINAGAFVIDGIAYVGTGRNSGTYESDFWKYNPQTGHWTRLGALNEDNDAAAIPRANAVTFSMHGKGYITLGDRSGNLHDVWEYNPVSDQWNQFHHFVGASRNGAVGFVLDDFAYVGTGGTGSMRLDDFWAFDPTSEYDEDSN